MQVIVNAIARPEFRNHGSCTPPNQTGHVRTSIQCAPAKVINPIAKLWKRSTAFRFTLHILGA